MAAAACGAVTAAGASPLDISYEEIPLEKIKAEDTLILSDSPEYARNYGILAEGTVLKGKGRIYYYHVNETGKPARLAVYGVSDKGEEIKVVRTLRGEPSRSYVPTGKTLSFREVTAKQQPPRNVMLEKGKRTILLKITQKESGKMIWSAVSWKWKHRRPSDSARLFFLMKAVWKSIWKRQGTFLRTPMKCGEHFPCTFILKAACGTRKKAQEKLNWVLPKAQHFFRKEGTNLISSGGKIRGTTVLPAI